MYINKKYIHEIDFEKISNDIEKLCEKLIILFDEGNSLKAVEFVKNLADMENLTSERLPEDLEFLNDNSIPVNLNIQSSVNI